MLLIVIAPFVHGGGISAALGSVLLVCGHIFLGFSYLPGAMAGELPARRARPSAD